MPFLTLVLLSLLLLHSPVFAQQSTNDQAVWTTVNIGSPLLGGSSRSIPCQPLSCPAIAIETSAAGWNAANGAADELTFVYKPLVDDGAVVARLESPAAQGGLSIRTGLAADAAAVSLVLSPTGVLVLHSRSADGVANESRPIGQSTGAVWLKLERRGREISAFLSQDGTQWTSLGQKTIPVDQTAYVGMVAASANPDTMLTATATSLHTERISSLPAGWNAVELGGQGSSGGSVSYVGGTFVILDWSGAIGDMSDRFGFAYLRVTGDAEIVARVIAPGKAGVSEAGVMVRESLDPNAANVFLGLTAPSARLTKRRIAAGLPATSGETRTVSTDWWLKLVRRGTLVSTFESPDGGNWSLVSSEALVLPDTSFLGLAFAAGAGVLTHAAFDQVSVRALVANKPPAVTLDSPVTGAVLAAGATVALSASASDPDDRVDAVEFYVDGARVGTDTAIPYQATWAGATQGTRVLTAVAIDSEGARTTSAPVNVNVSGPEAIDDGTTPPVNIPPSEDTTTLPPVSVPPPIVTPPVVPTVPLADRWRLQFAPSADHYSTVNHYVLEVFKADHVSLALTLDLGLPAVVDGVCTADLSYALAALATGDYILSLRAVADGRTPLSSSAATVVFTR